MRNNDTNIFPNFFHSSCFSLHIWCSTKKCHNCDMNCWFVPPPCSFRNLSNWTYLLFSCSMFNEMNNVHITIMCTLITLQLTKIFRILLISPRFFSTWTVCSQTNAKAFKVALNFVVTKCESKNVIFALHLPMSSIKGAIRNVTPTKSKHINKSRQAVAIIVQRALFDMSSLSITWNRTNGNETNELKMNHTAKCQWKSF